MVALRLNEYVNENGLFIDSKKLKNFKNKNVEVIILPAIDPVVRSNGSALNEIIGKLRNITIDPLEFQKDMRNEW